MKRKILFFVERYSQISETYIQNELNALGDRYEIRITALKKPDLPCENHAPYTIIAHTDDLEPILAEFQPDVVHGHYMTMAKNLQMISRVTGAPFTIRAHSFDILGKMTERLAEARDIVNSPACLGVLTFPFTVRWFVKAGCDPDKVHGCYPVVDVGRFADRSPNGKGVMNVGACLPKKNMEDFVRLGAAMPETTFNLYPLGYNTGRIAGLNLELGEPITIKEPVQPEDMAPEYKKHEWLVYTACPRLKTVGWPLAVAEAQASGVGVCMQNIRPDLGDYVGDCGFLFDSVEDARRIVSQPFPEELRQRGFELAWRADVKRHIHLLEDLWARAA